MNPRTIRRAAERAALKAARKDQAAAPQPISLAQFQANRSNAQLSHGPTSKEGKAISSRNHTQHGLTVSVGSGPFKVLPGEDQSDYDNCLLAFKAEWQPATATELDLVERMATYSWLRCRAQRLQDERIAKGMHEMQDYKQFEILSRYHTTHMRAFNKAFADLMRLRTFQMRQKKDEAMLQRHAQQMEIRFESQKRKAVEHVAKMETIRLRQDAQKQRNQRLNIAETTATSSETATSATATVAESGS